MSKLSGLAAVFFCLVCGVGATKADPPLSDRDLDAALTQVEARLQAQPDDLQLIFTHGMVLAELGRWQAAADAFRAMLVQDPGLLRPRLELARVLAENGDGDAARYHFEQVLAHDLPDAVRRNVAKHLARIREEMPAFSATLELVSDSNPKQATAAEEVVIGGLTYRLNSDARAASAMGLRVVLDGRVPLPQHPVWFVRGQAEHQEFDGTALDFSWWHAAAGRHIRLGPHTLTLELGTHAARYQHKPLYAGATGSLADFYPLRPDLSLRTTLSGMQFAYPEHPFRDGWQHALNGVLTYAATPETRWEVNAGYTQTSAQEAAYRTRQAQLGLRLVREWPGGWITGLGGHISQTRYLGADPFFAEVRHEQETRLEADLVNRRLRFWRLSPRLQVGWSDHHSNLDFFTWQRGFVRLGMTGEF
jgi:outer membrane protein